jgi:hypothetical protein
MDAGTTGRGVLQASIWSVELGLLPGDNYLERSASIMMSGLRACAGRA